MDQTVIIQYSKILKRKLPNEPNQTVHSLQSEGYNLIEGSWIRIIQNRYYPKVTWSSKKQSPVSDSKLLILLPKRVQYQQQI